MNHTKFAPHPPNLFLFGGGFFSQCPACLREHIYADHQHVDESIELVFQFLQKVTKLEPWLLQSLKFY